MDYEDEVECAQLLASMAKGFAEAPVSIQDYRSSESDCDSDIDLVKARKKVDENLEEYEAALCSYASGSPVEVTPAQQKQAKGITPLHALVVGHNHLQLNSAVLRATPKSRWGLLGRPHEKKTVKSRGEKELAALAFSNPGKLTVDTLNSTEPRAQPCGHNTLAAR